MLIKIKNRIDKELATYTNGLDSLYSLSSISPLLFKYIKEFILREGKRVRPILLVLGYLGFCREIAPGLYRSALSIELLHDFMLVHDDIIDKSNTRRGKPSMHKMFNDYLRKYKGVKFSGEDLTIVAGDVIYAMGINAFLSIKENKERKEAALRKLIEAALYTGSGEFIELVYGIKDTGEISRSDIYKIYDYKTACYTFASPLAIGAILAGAHKKEVDKLYRYGILLGRAFQIKDDILGMFREEKETGKSALTDLQEAKKTILIWYAYNNSPQKEKKTIEKILSKEKPGVNDLSMMRGIITSSGALDYAKNEISAFLKEAQAVIESSKIRSRYKNLLKNYSSNILNV